MSDILKTIRLTGTSRSSFEDAISVTIARAAQTIVAIDSFDVVSLSGEVDQSGVISGHRVVIDVHFAIRESPGL